MEKAKSSDKAMLDEIRSYLASSKTAKKAAAAAAVASSSSSKSPYGPLPKKGDAVRAESTKTIKARKNQTSEDLVDYYTAQYMQAKRANKLPNQLVSQEDIIIKDINMPYADTIHKIAAQLTLSDRIEHKKSIREARLAANATALPLPPTSAALPGPPTYDEIHASKSSLNALHISAEHLRNRFPRLLRGMHIDELAVQQTQPRSDVWMAKFMEDCYDEAFLNCSQDVADSRKMKRCGLYLGSMDAFPLVIQRLLGRVFSVLAVREAVVLEILVTLETSSWRSDVGDTRDDFTELALRSGRCDLFAQFLSEEFDLSYLAIFLHNRDLLQRQLGVALKDLNATRIWVEGGREAAARNTYRLPAAPPIRTRRGASGGGVEVEKPARLPVDDCSRDPRLDSKVVPVLLPEGMSCIADVGLPEAPLPGFDSSILRTLCEQALPSDKKLSAYLHKKILEDAQQKVVAGLKRQSSLFDIHIAEKDLEGRALALDRALFAYAKKTTFIPVYGFLLVLLDQWRRVPVEQKYSFGADGQSMLSIGKLNKMYDKNCESMRSLEREIFGVNTKIGQSNAAIAQLEKAQRRLGRKWSCKIISEDEMLELQRTRVQLTTARAEKMPLETRLSLLLQKQALQDAARDSLWVDAASVYVIEPPSEAEYRYDPLLDGSAKPVPSWRTDSQLLLLSSVTLHEDVEATARQLRLRTRQEQQQQQQYEQPLSGEPEEDTPPPSPAKEEKGDEFATMISSLQREAQELAATGSAEALSVGLTPVSVREQAERERRREREQEVSARHYMDEEDSLSRSVRRRWAVEREAEIRRRAEALRVAAEALEARRWLTYQLLSAEAQLLAEGAVCSATREISSALLARQQQREQQLREKQLQAERMAQEQMDNTRMVASLVGFLADRVAAAEADRRARELLVIRTTSTYEASMCVTAGVHSAAAYLRRRQESEDHLCIKCSEAVMASEIDELVASAMPAAAEVLTGLLLSSSFESLVHSLLTDTIEEAFDLLAGAAVDTACAFIGDGLVATASAEAIGALIDDALLAAADSTAGALVEAELPQAVEGYLRELQQMRDAIAERVRVQEMAAQFVLRSLLQEMLQDIAALELQDPWDLLNVHPAEWLSESLLMDVDERYERSLSMRRAAIKATVVRVLRRGRRLALLKRSIASRELRETLLCWRSAQLASMRRAEGARCLQRFSQSIRDRRLRATEAQKAQRLQAMGAELRRQLLLRRAAGAMAYLHHRIRTRRSASRVQAHLKERRFLFSFYTWLDKYNRKIRARREKSRLMERASLVIQCFVRIAQARHRRRQMEGLIVIKRRCRVYLAQRLVAARKIRARRVAEAVLAIGSARLFSAHKIALAAWRRMHNYSTGLGKIARLHYTYRHRANFAKLKRDTAYYFAGRTAMVVLIQSAGRMLIAKQKHLNYYRWRRGLCCVQGHVRRRRAIPQFTYDMYYYRRAKRIQRLYRGYVLRNRLTLLRIRDLHHAAAANNYERLSYYCRKYPELVSELDEDGNTALHNAAKTAAKRTLKLLLKSGLAANALNLTGYSALHLVIQSPSLRRDECCVYMLDRGFDEDQVTPDGKTCLLLACECGRGPIVRRLLELGGRINQPDHNGTTPLQAACTNGYFLIAKMLIEAGSDVNTPGYCGTLPFHDLVAAASLDIANLLFCHGAYINVYEPYYYQTPLMWAGFAGLLDIVKLYLLQGADVNMKDYRGWTCIHHAACSNNMALYDAFREANADFDALDNEGNTPLHIATENGATDFARALLEGCCNPSIQNAEGNQPSHLAARLNNVSVLEEICRFDQHIGRMNFAHQTPMGVARFHCSREATAFLQKHYRLVEIDGGRNDFGELWWDQHIDATLDGWRVITDYHGKRTWYNDYTGEATTVPPSIPSQAVLDLASYNQLNLMRRVTTIVASDIATKHAYNQEYVAMQKDVEVMKYLPSKATIINKWARRKSAYLALRRLRKRAAKLRFIAIWVKKWLPRFTRWKRWQRTDRATRLQAAFRGHRLRIDFYNPSYGEYNERFVHRARLRLRQRVWRAWRRYKAMRYIKCLEIAKNLPRTLYDWAPIVKEAHWPVRTVGVFEEYRYPGSRGIFFYRHKVTGDCVFQKPARMQQLDDMHWRESKELQSRGFTKRQEALVTTLQALWRGYAVRTYYLFIERAMEVSLNAQRSYMDDPDSERNLANYAIHCHLVENDLSRARFLYLEAVRRMEWRGPDSPFILYAYAIFGFVTHDLDYSDVCFYLERARKAEEVREDQSRKARGEMPSLAIQNGTYRHGKIFDFAKIGFYKHIARDHDDTVSWHNFAGCCFLIYNDFNGSFDAFLEAFKTEPGNVKLKENFDIMMRHYCGNSKERCDAKIRDRMQRLAQIDADTQNEVTRRRDFAQKRVKECIRIQRWYRLQKKKKVFAAIVRESKARKEQRALRAGRALHLVAEDDASGASSASYKIEIETSFL